MGQKLTATQWFELRKIFGNEITEKITTVNIPFESQIFKRRYLRKRKHPKKNNDTFNSTLQEMLIFCDEQLSEQFYVETGYADSDEDICYVNFYKYTPRKPHVL